MYVPSCISILFFFTVLGLRCCMWAFSSCGEQGLHSSCNARASHRGYFSHRRGLTLGCLGFTSCSFWTLECGFSSCGTEAQLLCMWHLPSDQTCVLTLAGRFLATGRTGKSLYQYLLSLKDFFFQLATQLFLKLFCVGIQPINNFVIVSSEQ